MRAASTHDTWLLTVVGSDPSPETTAWFWKVASTAADPWIRAQAVYHLPSRDPEALPRLREWLRQHESPEVRGAARTALYNAGWSEESALVFRELARRPEQEEADLGVLGLRATEDGDRAVLCEVARHVVLSVRLRALGALQSFVGQHANVRDAFLDRLRNDPDRLARYQAATVLAARVRETEKPDPAVLSALRDAAARDGDEEVRFQASEALRAHDRRR